MQNFLGVTDHIYTLLSTLNLSYISYYTMQIKLIHCSNLISTSAIGSAIPISEPYIMNNNYQHCFNNFSPIYILSSYCPHNQYISVVSETYLRHRQIQPIFHSNLILPKISLCSFEINYLHILFLRIYVRSSYLFLFLLFVFCQNFLLSDSSM